MPPERIAGGNPSGPPRVEEIREELRRRGYLDSPLERFLLRDLLGGRFSVAASLARVALRTGLLGGPLVGGPVAVVTWATGAGGPGTLVTLALALSVTFGVILAMIELASGMIASRSRLPGSAARATTRAAMVVAGVGVVYLSLWWLARRRQIEAPGWLDLLSAAWIAGVAFSLGRLTSAAGRVLAVGRAASLGLPAPARPTGKRWVLVALLVGAVGLAFGFRWLEREPHEPGRIEITPVAGRLVVVGIDGIGSEALAFARRRNLTPSLAALVDTAAWRRLSANAGEEPPSTWTTLATGVDPTRHGVAGVEWRSLAGAPSPVDAGPLLVSLLQVADALIPAGPRLVRDRPVSASIRRVPTVWEIAGRRGVRVLAAHWWASSPAADLPGYVFSDRTYSLLERGLEPEGEVHPSADGAAILRRFPGWKAGAVRELGTGGQVGLLARRALLVDRFYSDAFLERLRDGEVRLAFLYLSSPDIVRAEERAGVEGVFSTATDLARSFQFVDGVVAAVRHQLRPEDRLVLILHPGRTAVPDDGLLALVGPGRLIGEGEGEGSIGPCRVAPTLLWLAGFPWSDSMGGGPVVELLEPTARQALPLRTVPDFGPAPRPAVRTPPAEADQRARDYLRSLGYLR